MIKSFFRDILTETFTGNLFNAQIYCVKCCCVCWS